jgi:hypothetical protein
MTRFPGLDMPLEDAMLTQRALRRVKPDSVDEALVLRLIELGIYHCDRSGREGQAGTAEPPYVAAISARGGVEGS